MALPPKRAANRRNGSNRGRNGNGNSRDPGQRPERSVSVVDHGTPYSRATQGSGSIAGAGELNTTPHSGPGPAARRYMGMDPEMYPSRSIPSGAPPKGMKTYSEE